MKSEGPSKNTPSILQTVYNLDANTIKDKETFIKVINENQKRKNNSEKIINQYFEVYDDTEYETEINSVFKSGTTTTTTTPTTTTTTTTKAPTLLERAGNAVSNGV